MTLLSLQPVIWLAIILAAIFCEAIFPSLIAVWCAPAALIALITGALGQSVWGQTVVFAAVSVVLIVISQIVRVITRWLDARTRSRKSSDDSI